MSRRAFAVTLALTVAVMASGCRVRHYTDHKAMQEVKALRDKVAKSGLPAVASVKIEGGGSPVDRDYLPAVRVQDRQGRWATALLAPSERFAVGMKPNGPGVFYANTGRWFVYGDPEYAEAMVRLCEAAGDVGAKP